MKFKTYILFAWRAGEAFGGFNDLITSFSEVHDARAFRVEDFDVKQIVDTYTGETLTSYRDSNSGKWSPWECGKIAMRQPARLRPTGSIRPVEAPSPAAPAMSQREKTVAILTAAGHSADEAERIALDHERGTLAAMTAVRIARAKADVAARAAYHDSVERRQSKRANISVANSR